MVSVGQVNLEWSMLKMSDTLRKVDRSFSLPCNLCGDNLAVKSVYVELRRQQNTGKDFSIRTLVIPTKKKIKINSFVENDPKLKERKHVTLDVDISVEEDRQKEKEMKKKKKWRKVDPAEVGFNITLFPRHQAIPSVENNGEIQAVLEKIDEDFLRMEETLSIYRHAQMFEGSNNTSQRYLRPDRHRKIRKVHKEVKDRYCRNIRNNDGRKKMYVHHRIFKIVRLIAKRNYLHYPSSKVNDSLNDPLSLRAETRRSERGAPAQDLYHALYSNNVPTDIPSELVSVLISLQHRDLTPEDYDTLLLLDDALPAKTISMSKLESFRTDVVDEISAGDICSVCLDPYIIGQTRKFLPCDHVFHVNCIDVWLQNSSMNCPLDGLPLD